MASQVDLTKANATFNLALFKKLSEEKKTENIFFSPPSISSSLAMVMMGARGNTARQMSKTLKLTETDNLRMMSTSPFQSLLHTREQKRKQIQPRSRLPGYLSKVLKPETEKDDDKTSQEDGESGKDDAQTSQEETKTCEDDAPTAEEDTQTGQDDVHAKSFKLWSELDKPDVPYDLNVANRLFGEKTYEFVQAFLEDIKKHYRAELESVDFKCDAEAVRTNINSWVEKQTPDQIKDMLTEGSVCAGSMLVLVNAICFKGKWNQKFEEEKTVDAEFRVNKKETKTVKMMQQINHLPLMSMPEKKLKILELPYQGEELSMIIILPDEIEDETTGLEKLEKELTLKQLLEWTCPDALGKIPKVEVEVKLPQFKLEETYILEELLTSMGMRDAFDAVKSDFSGLSPAKEMALSKVVHKAFMKVDEEGSSAASATSKADSDKSSPPTPAQFTADHPFIFFILHKPMKTILFSGRFCCPE